MRHRPEAPNHSEGSDCNSLPGGSARCGEGAGDGSNVVLPV